ncbi:MAG: IS1634 family transposase [Alphaproteobacteria bacterium]
MSSTNSKKLKRFRVGGLPIIRSVIERMKLNEILHKHIRPHGNEAIPAAESLILLIYNLTQAKAPLYELEEWVKSLDQRCLNSEDMPYGRINDDRFGRALDKLFSADRASLLTDIVTTAVKEFNLDLSRIHNDSTTVKACGSIPGRTSTGLELKHGKSKDHRPDLKQLVYNLSITSDGAVPIHHHCYPGNRTDDTIHIEVWNALQSIYGDSDFLYVADSKLCTDAQLNHICRNNGKAVTIIPETWKETKEFKETLRTTIKTKKEIWRRLKQGSETEFEYFSVYYGNYRTKKRGYKIHWIYSSEKRKRDRASREKKLRKAEHDLMELNGKINQRNFKKKEAIEQEAKTILKNHNVEKFIRLDLSKTQEEEMVQIGRGKPGKNTKYKKIRTTIYTLAWSRCGKELKRERKVDGIFPLLCTSDLLNPHEVLKAYKYQPKLEKRFCQFKWIHNAAPLLFKKIERVEANMFAFFISLIIQALIEREVRSKMREKEIQSLTIYPEEREASHPTTTKIMRIFENISTYTIAAKNVKIEEFRDDLTETQKQILELLEIKEDRFWCT